MDNRLCFYVKKQQIGTYQIKLAPEQTTPYRQMRLKQER
jgi:hypothetical protein